MRRITLEPRPDWRSKLVELGMDLDTGRNEAPASPYWAEDAAYVFGSDAIESLHVAVDELAVMMEAAVEQVIAKNRFAELGIPSELGRLAAASWEADEPSLYGRFFAGTVLALRSCSNTMPTRQRRCSRRRSYNGIGWRSDFPATISTTRSTRG
jgi:glutathionylspermidine synthase